MTRQSAVVRLDRSKRLHPTARWRREFRTVSEKAEHEAATSSQTYSGSRSALVA